tara:strand:+ start:202 stop:486 length:285 start_codon:yes stop_codon:yes gene_type:complete
MYKIGDKIKKTDGSIRVVTLYDQLASLGSVDLGNKVDIKTWTKFDRFFHGFTVAARLSKNKPGKKLLKDLNIKVGIGPMNLDKIVNNHKELNPA